MNGAAASDGRRPMSLEDVLGPCHRLGRLEFTPDGIRIIYEYAGALWITDRAGNRERLTEGRAPRWSPTGEELAFLRGDPTQVWTRSSGGEEQQRTRLPRGVSDFAWYTDGRRLAALSPGEADVRPAAEPRSETIVELHRPRVLPGTDLWVVTLGTEAARRVPIRQRGMRLADWSNLAIDPSGRWMVLPTETGKDEAEHLVILDVATGASHRLIDSVIRPCSGPQWSPDGGRLAFLYSPHDHIYPLQKQCAVVPMHDGRPTCEITCHGEGYFISEARDELCWHPDGQTLFAIGIRGSTRQVLRIDLTTGEVRALTDQPGWCGHPRLSSDGRWLAFTYTSPTCIGQLCLLPAEGGSPRVVLEVNDPLREIALSEVELVHWRAKDGMRLEGVVVKPLNYQPGRRYPLVVDLHGGPAPGGTAQYNRSWHWLAANGYLVFSPDFRTGQTYAWVEPEAHPLDFHDVMAGVDQLVRAGQADPERMGFYGFSYGADLGAWVLGHTGRFRAAVVSCGGYDWTVGYGMSGGWGTFSKDLGGPPWRNPEAWRRLSPLTYLHRATTPTLLLTGDSDLVHIRIMLTWLQRVGVEVEAIHYKGEGHGFSRPEHARDWLERMLAWFDRHLKGEKVAPSMPA